jgi:hypothetical protein
MIRDLYRLTLIDCQDSEKGAFRQYDHGWVNGGMAGEKAIPSGRCAISPPANVLVMTPPPADRGAPASLASVGTQSSCPLAAGAPGKVRTITYYSGFHLN